MPRISEIEPHPKPSSKRVENASLATFFRHLQGGVHDPTALVIILDNSMSSGLIREGDRVLDLLKKVALKSVNSSSAEDIEFVIFEDEPSEFILLSYDVDSSDEELIFEIIEHIDTPSATPKA